MKLSEEVMSEIIGHCDLCCCKSFASWREIVSSVGKDAFELGGGSYLLI